LNNIAHQWRQPLNSIALAIQGCLLENKEEKLDRAAVKGCTDRCMEQIGQLSKTINLFQRFFAPEEEPREFDPMEMVERSVSLVRAGYEQAGITIRTVNHGAVPMTGFGIAFSQALLSILNNAKEALLARATPEPAIEIECGHQEGRNLVTVRDNAGGIDEAVRDRIFDPYFTTKFQSQGTGLGLYMAKMIIEKNMRGSLSVGNAQQGAEFRIELPV
jgi:signal transduction histidine kinase